MAIYKRNILSRGLDRAKANVKASLYGERKFVFDRFSSEERDRKQRQEELNRELMNEEFERIKKNRVIQKARAKANRYNGIKKILRF